MNFISFGFAWGLSICAICATMQATGLGHPNCEPTTFGYVAFYYTLFGCSVLSYLLAMGMMGIIIAIFPPRNRRV